MNQLEVVLSYSKKIEGILVEKFGATGRGLHEKLSSAIQKVPHGYFEDHKVSLIRYIASVRNYVVHEDGATIEDLNGFIRVGNEVVDYLNQLTAPAKSAKGFWKTFDWWGVFLSGLKKLEIKLSAWVSKHSTVGWIGGALIGLFLGLYYIGLGAGILFAAPLSVIGRLLFSAWGVEKIFQGIEILAAFSLVMIFIFIGLNILGFIFLAVVLLWNFGKIG